MSNTSFRQPLRGVVPPMITPLRSAEELHVDGLERLIEHLIGGGVAGLFVLGTTGEGPALSPPLQRELVERTCQWVRGRVPVLVGVTDTSLAEASDLSKFAADAGADAVVTAGPFYLPVSQAELVRYVTRLAERMPLPVFVYNMPGLTKNWFDAESLRALADHPQIVGVKDSSADLIYFQRILQVARQRPDWTVLIGPEELTLHAVLEGAHGGVNGGANVHPRLYAELVEVALAGDWARARQLHQQVLRFAQNVYTLGRSRASIVQGLKAALAWLGICDDALAEPADRLDVAQREQLRERLVQLGLLAPLPASQPSTVLQR